ncbi:hypothetical protein LMG9449_0559 [Lactococcus lactis subsp. lactis]|jgi:hypothetical protein|uniref:Uncharacterized protein n=2 Tax=Lactococcus lactis subsp. lactis TaxID=1360 RepID=A0A0V8E5B8_LACLL|nr:MULTISPECIES: hypothetical protein [Lactobacillales]ADA64436.1 Hypothetical protein, extracellular [Lactococcus lactis subsp. lactis KF147]AII12186.1 Hypothetical protein NCDO2118_0693 [Lactococcus lactis subsp. lactis NCDO 2118]KST93037.1 hypothetical protein KF134_0089 [Lactococcus lactis subsp. lactis]KSU20824.1 hypothetical protein LMG9449_0559 [Lactococcus lactis subsp. lactis]MBU5366805.1 hypothetical protein [Enterococcus devriesei]
MKLKKFLVLGTVIALGTSGLSGFTYVPGFSPKKVSAASISYNHNHAGYKCYKITTYMPASKVKTLVSQGNKITNATNWAAALGGAYKGWIGALSFVYGQNVQAQLAPFRAAAKKSKGVEYSYIYHDSLYTTASYSSNYSFTAK